MAKFKVGDQVQLLEGPYMPTGWVGKQGTILEILPLHEMWPYLVAFSYDGEPNAKEHFRSNEFKLANSTLIKQRLGIK